MRRRVRWPDPVVEMLLERLARDPRASRLRDVHRGRLSSDRRLARFASGPPITPPRFGNRSTSHESLQNREIGAPPLARARFPI